MTGLALHEMYYITFAVLRLLGVCPAVRAHVTSNSVSRDGPDLHSTVSSALGAG